MAAKPRKTRKSLDTESTENEAVIKPNLIRDENGLLKKGVEYSFSKSGFIDWENLIDRKFIFLNKFSLAVKGVDLEQYNDEEREKLLNEKIERGEKEDLVIGLWGFRSLAQLRGFKRISSKLVNSDESSAIVTVEIEWIPNLEHPNGLTVQATASATTHSTEGKFNQFLEAIAENRAFCRAVRHSLGIVPLAQEELNWNERPEVKKEKSPELFNSLNNHLKNKGYSFDDFKNLIINQELGWKDEWNSYSDIDNGNLSKLYNLAVTLPKLKEEKELESSQ